MTQTTVKEKHGRDDDLMPLVLDFVGDLRAERDRLLENLNQTSFRLAAKDASNAALEASLALVKKELADKGDTSAEAGESKPDRDDAHDRDLAAVKNRNAALQKELTTATKQVSKHEVELAETKQALQKSRKHAAAMEDKLARKTEDHKRAMELLYERTDERDKADDRATAHEQTIKDLKLSLEEAKQKIAALENAPEPHVASGEGVDVVALRRHLSAVAKHFDGDSNKAMRSLMRAMKVVGLEKEEQE